MNPSYEWYLNYYGLFSNTDRVDYKEVVKKLETYLNNKLEENTTYSRKDEIQQVLAKLIDLKEGNKSE